GVDQQGFVGWYKSGGVFNDVEACVVTQLSVREGVCRVVALDFVQLCVLLQQHCDLGANQRGAAKGWHAHLVEFGLSFQEAVVDGVLAQFASVFDGFAGDVYANAQFVGGVKNLVTSLGVQGVDDCGRLTNGQ